MDIEVRDGRCQIDHGVGTERSQNLTESSQVEHVLEESREGDEEQSALPLNLGGRSIQLLRLLAPREQKLERDKSGDEEWSQRR